MVDQGNGIKSIIISMSNGVYFNIYIGQPNRATANRDKTHYNVVLVDGAITNSVARYEEFPNGGWTLDIYDRRFDYTFNKVFFAFFYYVCHI